MNEEKGDTSGEGGFFVTPLVVAYLASLVVGMMLYCSEGDSAACSSAIDSFLRFVMIFLGESGVDPASLM